MAFDLQVFNKQTYTVMTETVAQEIEKFNQASGGAIMLINKPFEGDFDIRTQFQQVAGLVKRRNAYGSGAVDSVRLKEMLDIAVKVAAGTPPVEYEKQQYLWTQRNPELAAIVLGEQLAKGRLADMLNAGIMCVSTAINANTAVVTDAKTKKASFTLLNKSASKFGDRSASIKAWIMHSSISHALYENALTNGENLFSYDTVNVIRDPFGKVFVVTDSPSLVLDQASDQYKSLGLVEGGLVVTGQDDFNAVLNDVTGFENIKYVYQAEWTYGVSVKGYSWDSAVKSPTDAQLGTAKNWKKFATSDKDTAGVILLSLGINGEESGAVGP